MARTELPNGVILPAEYSDDWYEDMTSNLTKLDDVIGSDSEKLNSNDVAFLRMSSAALTDGGTGNFSDLNSSNKLKTGDYVLDSGRKLYQVVSVDSTNETFTVGNSLFKITAESDLAPVAESGDYDDLDNKPDLNPYDQHIADTDIHVTTADKTKWNNGVSQAYVFRYSSTALVASSTNSNTLLDNTDNLKVGDKVIDSNGVLFSITAIDSVNSTFTIGSALADLALDANVVHTSGVETVGGNKTFTNDVTVNNSNATVQADVPNLVFKNSLMERASTTLDGEQTILFTDKNDNNIGSIQAKTYTSGMSDIILTSYSETSDQSVRTTGIVIRRTPTTSKLHGFSDNITSLGDTNRRWKSVYAMNYYYGNDNVEFSTKFVTTDTAQTITGAKTFSEIVTAKVNGLTPSSLGMPTDNIANIIDISGYLTVLDGSQANTYQAPDNGYIGISMSNCTGVQGFITGFWGNQVVRPTAGSVRFIMPICKNMTANLLVYGGTIDYARFFPCQGNI